MAKLRKYIDIGANLTDAMYLGFYNGSKKHDEDLKSVINRSWDAGLDKIIITGTTYDHSIQAIEIAKSHENLFATVGCHPTHCLEFEANESEGNTPEKYYQKLKALATQHQNKVVAIGECGLDYDREHFCPRDVQKKYFAMQLKLAEETKLPLFLHCRNAASDLLQLLQECKGLKGVVHSFDGTLDEAEAFLKLGYYIGINGCSLKTKENLETVKGLPVDKILIETDSPWCEIRPTHAGYSLIDKMNFTASVKKEKWKEGSMIKGRNEPANIRQVLDVISSIRGANVDELAEQIYQSTICLFFMHL